MSITTSEMTPADIAAVTNGGSDGMFGGNGAWWIIILFLFCFAGGWGGRGMGGGSGAAENYVLTSDFAQVERKLDSITNGLCDGFYTQAQLINGVNTNILTAGNAIQSQLAQCCCDIREGIAGVNYNMATNANMLSREVERGFCDTNYNMATQHNATLQAVDRVGDRIIDYMTNQETQRLRDENNAYRLAASQQAQNNFLISQLKAPCPIPAYTVPNPNCCYNNGGCGGF